MTYMPESYLAHYGVAGMKWGVRHYQNPDGTLTAKGRKHYGTKHYERMARSGNKSFSSTRSIKEGKQIYENKTRPPLPQKSLIENIVITRLWDLNIGSGLRLPAKLLISLL